MEAASDRLAPDLPINVNLSPAPLARPGVISNANDRRPIIFLDISARSTNFENKDELVGLFLNQISRSLSSSGIESAWKATIARCWRRMRRRNHLLRSKTDHDHATYLLMYST